MPNLNPFGAIFLDAVKRLVESETGEDVSEVRDLAFSPGDPEAWGDLGHDLVIVEYIDEVNHWEKVVHFRGTCVDFMMRVARA